MKLSKKGKASSLDRKIGRRVRQQRVAMGLSTKALGKALGITFQAVQKYENASNRISASRLYVIAQTLKVPITYFFQDASNN